MPKTLNEKREAARGTTERNRAIMGAYCDGIRPAEIARRFHVSDGRIRDIIRMYKLRAIRYNREKEKVHVQG